MDETTPSALYQCSPNNDSKSTNTTLTMIWIWFKEAWKKETFCIWGEIWWEFFSISLWDLHNNNANLTIPKTKSQTTNNNKKHNLNKKAIKKYPTDDSLFMSRFRFCLVRTRFTEVSGYTSSTTARRYYISVILASLYWLPVKSRFKILTNKILNNPAFC